MAVGGIAQLVGFARLRPDIDVDGSRDQLDRLISGKPRKTEQQAAEPRRAPAKKAAKKAAGAPAKEPAEVPVEEPVDDGGDGGDGGEPPAANGEQAQAEAAEIIEARREANSAYLEVLGQRVLTYFIGLSTLAALWGLHDRLSGGNDYNRYDKALVAVAIIGVLLMLTLVYLNAGSGGVRRLFIGKDGRFSTSVFQAAMWTIVLFYAIAYMYLAVYFGTHRVDCDNVEGCLTFSGAFSELDQNYLFLLGGPFAAAAAARASVAAKTSSGSQQKQQAADTAVGDLTKSDAGTTDLVDTQFLVFNVLTLVYFLIVFIDAPSAGLPSLPSGLVALTSIAALTYATNKALASNAPMLRSVARAQGVGPIRAGDIVVLRGANFAVSDPDETEFLALITVKFGETNAAIRAKTKRDLSPERLRVQVPIGLAAGTHDVVVVTPAGAESNTVAVEIADDKPVILSVNPVAVRRDESLTIVGRSFSPVSPRTKPRVLIDDVPVESIYTPASRTANGLDKVEVGMATAGLADDAEEFTLQVESASTDVTPALTLKVAPAP